MALIRAWRNWKEEGPPFVLPEDRPLIQAALDARVAVAHNWNSSIADPEFGDPSDQRFHLGLLPIPFVGNLTTASVYVLLLNPGLGPHDYFGEYEVPEYRAAAIANLRQERETFLFLDPRSSWHGGFDYWNSKFASLIAELARRKGTSFASARARLARALACIELIPYHSPSFKDPARWVENLPSAQLARQFVQEVVVQRVQEGQAVVVVARKSRVWDLPKHEGIVAYDGAEARAAHLTPNSRGGKLILDHLSRT